MTGQFGLAHLVAAGLIGLDFAARTARLRWLLAVARVRIGWWDSLCVNAWADVGAALTPFRVGGEPARIAGLKALRVPLGRGLGALALEVTTATPVTVAIGGALAVGYGQVWWPRAAASLERFHGAWWLAVATLGVIAGLWWATRRIGATRGTPRTPRLVGSAWALAASAGCSAVNVLCRVMVLPVLAWGAGYSGGLGEVALGSFVLLYAQLFAPVPAGMGVIDAVFLAGGAGVADLGVLVAWRAYTTGAGASLGGVLAAIRLANIGRAPLGGFGDIGGRDRPVVVD